MKNTLPGPSAMRILCVLAALLFILTACTRQTRIDRHELSLRLAKADERYAFSAEDVLISQNRQLIFYSLREADDCLLTLTTDSVGQITALTLTLERARWSNESLQSDFFPLCKAAWAAFCTDESLAEEAFAALTADNAELFTSDTIHITTLGEYTFRAYRDAISYTLECTYGEEPTTKK